MGNDCTASYTASYAEEEKAVGAIQPFLVSTQFWGPAKCVLTNQT